MEYNLQKKKIKKKYFKLIETDNMTKKKLQTG